MILGRQPRTPHLAGNPPKHQNKRLLPRHHKIIELALAGHSYRAIAAAVGVDPMTVSTIMRSPLVQAEFSRRRSESDTVELAKHDRNAVLGRARIVLEGAAERAAEKHVSLLDAQNESVQLRSAEKILDRVFGRAEETTPNVNISAEQVQLLVIALKESRNDNEEQSTNCTSAYTPSDGQGDVLQANPVGSSVERSGRTDNQGSVEEQVGSDATPEPSSGVLRP